MTSKYGFGDVLLIVMVYFIVLDDISFSNSTARTVFIATSVRVLKGKGGVPCACLCKSHAMFSVDPINCSFSNVNIISHVDMYLKKR